MASVDDMLLVIEIADTGNFTQAGARLGMPKSTLSHRVTQLEKRLGLRLFNRSTRHVSLTSNGQVYLEYCRRIRARDRGRQHGDDQPQGTAYRDPKNHLPGGHRDLFYAGIPWRFPRKFPRVAIELIATNQHLDLIRERVDFAFRVGSVSNQNFIVRKVSTIKRVLVASPEYLAAGSPIREPGDLLQHRCLLHNALPDWTFTAENAQVVFRPPAAAKSNSLGFLLQSSLAGNGVALLPAYVCQPALAAGRLIELLPGWELTPYDMTLVFPDRKNQSKAQAAFRGYVDACDFSHFATGRAPMPSS